MFRRGMTHIIFFKTIMCHTSSEPQARSDLIDDDDNNDEDDDDDDDDTNDENKEEDDDDKNYFFQKYQVSYLFGTTSSV